MALAALETGKRTAKQTSPTPGYFMFARRRFMDDKIGGHGSVDLHKSIVVSCTPTTTSSRTISASTGIANFMGPARFSHRTGIDIPGEAEGVMPSPEWKRGGASAGRTSALVRGETISVGIGQGYNGVHAVATRERAGDRRQRRKFFRAARRA